MQKIKSFLKLIPNLLLLIQIHTLKCINILQEDFFFHLKPNPIEEKFFNKCIDQPIEEKLFLDTPQNLYKSYKKKWTFLVFMAADNDLRFFATNNIKQMAEIGSNEFINIVIHLDIRINAHQKITRRYYIEKNKIIHVAQEDTENPMDSGDPETLISFGNWAINNYPAQDYALIFWNHGTGIIDPKISRTINPSQLFHFNPTTHKLELDRSMGFLDLLNTKRERGICWNDSTGNFLTNQKLHYGLTQIRYNSLNNQKFSIIGCDACLMMMLEVGNNLAEHADILVASQEVELGWGWHYANVLTPFLNYSPDKFAFSKHIVQAYEDSYKSITNDYTQSAINLKKLSQLEKKIDEISLLLCQCLKEQHKSSVKSALRSARNKQNCTHFDEPRYIDLYDFLTNIYSQINNFSLKNPQQEELKNQLRSIITSAKKLIDEIVIFNVVGTNLKRAKGISIYFPDYPDKQLDTSYQQTLFAQNNHWPVFLTQYLVR